MKLELVCADDWVDELAAGIAGKVRTGRQGDEKIFVLPVRHSIDIRTFAGSDEDQSE